MNDVSLLIVSDHYDNADILAHGLSQGGIEAAAISVEDFANKDVSGSACAMVIFDIYDAATDIASMCIELCTEFDGPVLVMCYERDERFLLDLYKKGIAEYVTRPIGMPLLMAKVNVWMRRASAVDLYPPQNGRNDFQIDELRRIVTTPEGDEVRLSKLEYQLFELLYRNRGRVLPANLLVERIWGDFEEGDGRLKHLVFRLRRKIEPDPSEPTYIETIDREGYRFRRIDRNHA